MNRRRYFMYIDKKLWEELKECIDNMYWDQDRMSRDGLYFLNKLDKYSKEIERKSSDKVYVITNNAIVDDEIDYSIYDVTTDKEEAKNIFKSAVRDMKCDSDFENINAINLNDFNNSDYDEEWVYSETDNSFELFLNGEYNSNNYSIRIIEYDINRSKDYLKTLDEENDIEL